MAKIIDITEKLNFEEKPKIKIKNQTLEVNDSATSALQLMGILSEADGSPTTLQLKNMYELIFSEADRKKIDKLRLNTSDWSTLIESAINLIVGDKEVGE